jgi:hypothetical protein
MSDKDIFKSIGQFIKGGGYHYRIYDMSRKIQHIPNHLFEKIESQEEVYPVPFKQQAWLGILFWLPEKEDKAIIWFLRFPIDELGFLKLASRDAFLQQLFHQLGDNAKAQLEQKAAIDHLQESPFAFKPTQDKLATFHAFAAKELGQPPSRFYQHTQDYLRGKLGFEQWSFLGIQGIADIIVRLDKDDNESILSQSIMHLPPPPLNSFSLLLEHATPGEQLSLELIKRLQRELASSSPDTPLIASLARGLSSSNAIKQRDSAFISLLESKASHDIEIIAAIAGRAWSTLKNKQILELFIESLANQEQSVFNTILMELLPVPQMRGVIFEELGKADKSEQLDKKIDIFMKTLSA